MIPKPVKDWLKRSPFKNVYHYTYTKYDYWKWRRNYWKFTEFDNNLLSFYKELLGEPKLIFDIGANIGLYTKAYVRLGARVVAVEPIPMCADVIRRIHGDCVAVEECAVSNSVGHRTFYVSRASGLSSLGRSFVSDVTSDPWDQVYREIDVQTITKGIAESQRLQSLDECKFNNIYLTFL